MQVTPLRWESSPFRRVLRFQSFGQLLHWAAFALPCLLAGLYVLHRTSSGHSTSDGVTGALLLLATLPSVGIALPQSFVVSGSDARRINLQLEDLLWHAGYTRATERPGYQYRSKLPALLSWRENAVRITQQADAVQIVAPCIIARRLHDAVRRL